MVYPLTGNIYRVQIGNIISGKNLIENIIFVFAFIWHIILCEQGIVVISIITKD